jgi:glutamine amidotransferase
MEPNPYVYFVHSYYLKAEDPEVVSSTTDYGVAIDASVQRGNLFATQFHPEKSGKTGLQMLKNFVSFVS